MKLGPKSFAAVFNGNLIHNSQIRLCGFACVPGVCRARREEMRIVCCQHVKPILS